MNLEHGDKVRVKRDIYRCESPLPYATAGEEGTVVECFRPHGTGANEKKPWYAKVMMPGLVIKTLRLTSLEAI